ncbi:MAG: hypothetical protein M3377_10960 [Actinomycetota bacterium]|nr:hypothetical protein [Actinomycetota bacterium]
MSRVRFAFLGLVAVGMLLFPVGASAEHGSADEASPNMLHVANLPQPPEFTACNRGSTACFNSDLAFWDAGAVKGGFTDMVAQGNYEGFRLIDVSRPEAPVQIRAVECRSNQGDLSFHQAENRLLLIQSIEEPVTTPECETAIETGVAPGTHPITGLPGTFRVPGFEGLRIFDVTNPLNPVLVAAVPTACGSHTHTTIDDQRNQRAIVYVSSYPTGARLTPQQGLGFGGPTCVPPHQRISIVEIPDKAPETARVLKEQPLDADTLPWRGSLFAGGTGAVGCHDITVYYDSQAVPEARQSAKSHPEVAGAACLEEGQLWDVSDPANPTTTGPMHSHIRNTAISTEGLFHTASFTWDGEVVLFTDEFGGGGLSGCKGPQDPKGNVWFYDNAVPGTPVVPLYGRYMIPRVQPASDICTLHNGNVIPTTDGYFGVSSAYEAGTSVFDFTGVESMAQIIDPVITPAEAAAVPLAAREVAFYDAKADGRGVDDAWSTYWHNDYMWTSSGLQRPGQRGFDVYMLLGMHGRLVDDEGNPTVTAQNANRPNVQQFKARKFRYQNPQTQDTFQTVKGASQGG